MIPQLIYIALTFLGLGIAIKEHGEEKTGKHNAWHTFIVAVLVFYLLYSGGFYDPLLK